MNTFTRFYLCASWAILRVLESIENDLRKAQVEWFSGFLVELWIQKITMLGLGNCGITVLPVRFWEEIGIWYKKDWKRFYLGVGLFSFFITFRLTSHRSSLRLEK